MTATIWSVDTRRARNWKQWDESLYIPSGMRSSMGSTGLQVPFSKLSFIANCHGPDIIY